MSVAKVDIKLHGILGQQMVKNVFKLAVSSVREAVNAIDVLTKRSFFKQLVENDKQNIKYRVLINGRDFKSNKPLTLDNIDDLKTSELAANIIGLKSIDIVPVLCGSGDVGNFFSIIAGVILMVVGVIIAIGGNPLGAALVVAGLGLVAAGVINLLSKPPKFDDFRDISNSGRKASYLFNGPENVEKEGGPVPIGYGRVMAGSQVISTSYRIEDKQLDDQGYIST